jgi:NADH dehydrogenase
VVLTPEEVDGLMAGLLVSKEPPRGKTRLADWLEKNKDRVGAKYASEIKKHYQPPVVATKQSTNVQA